MSGTIFPAAFAAEALARTGHSDKSYLDPEFSAIKHYLLKEEMPAVGRMSVKNRAMLNNSPLKWEGFL